MLFVVIIIGVEIIGVEPVIFARRDDFGQVSCFFGGFRGFFEVHSAIKHYKAP